MERGELESMGDSLGPGAISELVGRRVKKTRGGSLDLELLEVRLYSE